MYSIEDQLMIDEAASNTQQPGQQGGNGPQENQQVMFAQIQGLHQEFNELCDTMQTYDSSLWADMGCQFRILNQNVHCIAVAPAWPINRCVQGAEADEGEADENGIHPFASMVTDAKDVVRPMDWVPVWNWWTKARKGLYSCRKRKGEVSLPLPKGSLGCHIQACACRLHSRSSNQQNHQSVTRIINDMRRDCPQGGHPNLCL